MQKDGYLTLRLLGSFEVRRNGFEAPLELRRKTSAVLAYLAATGRPQTRQALIDMFCQEADDPQSAFRSILSRIRQRLGPNAFRTEGDTVQFNRQAGWVDCLEFGSLLSESIEKLPVQSLLSAVELYRGEFLSNLSLDDSPEFEIWLLNERTRYQILYEHAQTTLIDRLIAGGQIALALPHAYALVQASPLLDDAHSRLIWLYAKSGQREAALEQYEHYRHVLWKELAIEPAPEIASLRDEIASGRLRQMRPSTPRVDEMEMLIPETGDFVGRSLEMSQLDQAWGKTGTGHPIPVLVSAEAGMGKTRLIHEFARTLPDTAFLVGECYESSQNLAYAPWQEVLQARLTQVEKTSLKQLSDLALGYLARLVPELPASRKKEPAIVPTSGVELNRLFTAISEFLLEIPAASPLMIFIDNLQWADRASLQLFHFLARRPTLNRVLLTGAFRSEETGNMPALQSLQRDLERQRLTLLKLSPLSPSSISALIAQFWPALPEGYRPDVCNMLIKATGGNPLFISEILRELAHTSSAPSALPVPKTVMELVRRRLELLPQSSRQVIEAMAVLDAPATPAQAQQASGCSQAQAYRAIEHAYLQGLIHPIIESEPTRYDFTHDLMREAVIGQTIPIRRQALHRRAALTLERSGVSAGTLAYHWQKAGDQAKEARYAMQAGEQAAAIYASEEALRFFERALQLVNRPAQRRSLMCRIGEVLQLMGRHKEAEEIYRQALALSEASGDRTTQARCQVALGRIYRLKGDYPAAMDSLEIARQVYLALKNRSGLIQALGGLGAVYWSQVNFPQALICFHEQLELARKAGDQKGEVLAAGSLAVVYTEQGDYARALEYYNQRLQIDLRLNDRLSLAKTIGNMGMVYADQGSYDHAISCYNWLLDVTLQLGDRQDVCVAVGNMISVYTDLSKYETAERLTLQALALGRALDLPMYLTDYLYAGAILYAQMERYQEASSLIDEAIYLALQVDRADIHLQGQLLSIRLRFLMGKTSTDIAAQELVSFLDQWREDTQQADILYELWRIVKPHEIYRQQAADLYRAIYGRTPKILYQQRYEELTGGPLPPPPPLPAPLEMVTGLHIDLPASLDRVDQIITLLGENNSLSAKTE